MYIETASIKIDKTPIAIDPLQRCYLRELFERLSQIIESG
jgi:hypothetical protein